MTEELEKEAKDFESRKHYRYEDNDYCGDIADGIIQAYLAGAEPREKRILELEELLINSKNLSDTIEKAQKKKIAKLEAQIEKMKQERSVEVRQRAINVIVSGIEKG